MFDVDGTLVTSCGAGRRAVERAFEVRFGSREYVSFSFAGMTDKAIVRDAFQAMGRTFSSQEEQDREIQAVLDFYLTILTEEVKRSPGLRIHDGILAAMEMAEAHRDRVALGLGTGNVQRGAEIKLGAVGIYDRFTFGGFADDSIVRSELLMAGARRGARVLGRPYEDCRVVVIGDTPRDVAAAKAIGAESIAVATGMHAVPELEACSPTYVFETLADARAEQALFGR
jgi:phosphoglycolate phosphatase